MEHGLSILLETERHRILQGVMGDKIRPFSCGTTICNTTDNISLASIICSDTI